MKRTIAAIFVFLFLASPLYDADAKTIFNGQISYFPIQVASSTALASVPDAANAVGQVAYVMTYGDYFCWHSGQTLSAHTGVVINGPTGQWTRMGVPNLAWQAQTTWSIDESNVSGIASDENTGIDDTHPLLNVDEFIRRVRNGGITANTFVRWMSDTTHSAINIGEIYPGQFPTGGVAPTLVFLGLPTVLRSGTLTGATDAPWTVTDSTLPTSWTSSGLVSTSSGVRIIRKTDGTKHAVIGYENSAKTAQTSPTTNASATYNVFTHALVSFAPGDAYEVISVPKFPRIGMGQLEVSFNGVYMIYLDGAGVSGGFSQVRLGGFRNFAVINNNINSGGTICYGVGFLAGASMSGTAIQNAFDGCILLGGIFQASNWGGDLNGMTNVIAKGGSFQVTHSSFARIGNLYVFDDTIAPAIQLNNNSIASLDLLAGSGNTGVILDVRDSGCSVNSRSGVGAFSATTSAAHPITIVGASKDYADLPFWSTNQNAGFVVN